ncbi:metallopeptidase family protein [Bauldia litoralis]|uniref:Predicted Zn-dependent protease, minimal metalloprotease (MMP)-like domain n=1 Tax=Bauldia litoralis TaxID=665467 RepID=A0A1G6ACM3_9HYPH|nr:metallopeptidase family protein [Bauldia litoralis]SDB06152.1 Predicted Zn-dependent protease, minimal metalloprotease (MMP)-like domain [Bauldia litoralis]
MTDKSTATNWVKARAPSLDDLEIMARDAFAALPETFRALTGNLPIQVADFPQDDVLDDLGIESEFGLLGLFQGIGLAHASAVPTTGEMPNMIWLYRRPILDYWAEHDESLGGIVTHVLIHEIGHHFGLSDEDMEAIERAAG